MDTESSPPVPAPAATARTDRAVWVALVLVLVLCSAYHGSVLPVLVTVIDQLFPITVALIGLLLSSASIGTMLASGIAGPLIDLIGERRVLIAGTLGMAGFLLLVAVSNGYLVFLVAAVGIAMMFNAVNMAVPLYIISLYPEWRRKSFALNLVTGVVPGLFFPVAVERLLVSDAFSTETVVRAPYVAIGGMTLLLWLLFMIRSPRGTSRGGHPQRTLSFMSALKRRVTPVLKNKRTWLFVLLMALHATGDTILYQWFPSFLSARFPAPSIGPGTTLSIFSVAYFLSRLIVVLIPDDWGRRLFVVVPGFAGGALLILALHVSDSTAAALLYPAGAFFWSFEFPAMFSEVFREQPEGFGSFQSVAFLIVSGVTFLVINGIGFGVDAGIDLGVLLTVVACCFPAFGLLSAIAGIGRNRSHTPHVAGTTGADGG